MLLASRLRQEQRGAAIVEFALIAPVFLLMIFGMFQMGRLFFAESDLNHALANGARHATIFPMPSDEDILDKVEEQLTGLNPELLVNEITHHNDGNGGYYSNLRVAYDVYLDFVFFQAGPIRLERQRRVHTINPNSGTTSTSTSTSSTSAGGTTTTSAGGTGDGGTTTSTSSGTTTTTSTSSGTTTTSTSSGTTTTSTSTGGTSSNGNGNGRGNGTCRRC